MKLTLDDILKATNGRLIVKHGSPALAGIGIDSRTIGKGQLFVAVKGAHFNGNDFVKEVVSKGVPAVIVDQIFDIKNAPFGAAIIQVEDTIDALGSLASWWRGHFRVPCVAITGSNGKTTTRELVSAVASAKGEVLKTEGNFNNLIGLPLTIFRWEDKHNVAVLEMGMNAKGEIKRLTQIARPDIGLITTINAAHLEKLGDIEGVASAKGELFENMDNRGTIIVNDEDAHIKRIAAKFGGRKITFGMQNTSDVQFCHMESKGLEETDLTFSVMGRKYEVKIPLPGAHNVMNALASFAAGLALEIDVPNMIENISRFRPMAMRFERVQLANGVCLVNDSYNANPQSMQAAFRTVGAAKRAGRFIAVLGNMLELGEQSASLHRELGSAVVKAGVSVLFTFGDLASEIAKGAISSGIDQSRVFSFENMDELEKMVEKEIESGDIILIKGSRGMRMERVVEYLKNNIGY